MLSGVQTSAPVCIQEAWQVYSTVCSRANDKPLIVICKQVQFERLNQNMPVDHNSLKISRERYDQKGRVQFNTVPEVSQSSKVSKAKISQYGVKGGLLRVWWKVLLRNMQIHTYLPNFLLKFRHLKPIHGALNGKTTQLRVSNHHLAVKPFVS